LDTKSIPRLTELIDGERQKENGLHKCKLKLKRNKLGCNRRNHCQEKDKTPSSTEHASLEKKDEEYQFRNLQISKSTAGLSLMRSYGRT
jgi:hypothetical protein